MGDSLNSHHYLMRLAISGIEAFGISNHILVKYVPKNAFIFNFDERKVFFFSKKWPPFWFRHFEYQKTNVRYGISDLDNLLNPLFAKIGAFFKKSSAILDPPFCFSKNRSQIRNQRARISKGDYFIFSFVFLSCRNDFWLPKIYISSGGGE